MPKPDQTASILPLPHHGQNITPPTSRSLGSLLTPEAFTRTSDPLLLLYCFAAPLSIALSQIALCTLIAHWILVQVSQRCLLAPLRESAHIQALKRFYAPIILWLGVALIATVLGASFSRSFPDTLKLAFYLLLPLCIFSATTIAAPSLSETLQKIQRYLLVLVGSQTLAAFHSIASKALDMQLPVGIPGAVTQAGQLALVIPASLSLMIAGCIGARMCIHEGLGRAWELRLLGIFFALLAITWPGVVAHGISEPLVQVLSSIGLLALIVIPQIQLQKKHDAPDRARVATRLAVLAVAIVCLFVALVIDLKRGPWLAVFIELVLFGLIRSRRFIAPLLVISVLLAVSVAPARERIRELPEHFSISGGREYMWSIGLELSSRYPLGLGLNNSSYMRVIDPDLPSTHRHMHNNFLNISVETGWLGLALYVWWIVVVIGIGFSIWRTHKNSSAKELRQAAIFGLMLGLALLGWQVAGLVEYNFGDGEVRLIALFFMGLLLAVQQNSQFQAE